ncbi:Chemotaxis regulator - transmits chemoreceptor signals to flagellar motor components CheY [hydrothermal vent metagenome]|uniref:Chemotaxis regulator - transmits chemoreceptor signals to flagellar motor components CheY n=1 Tax=hydrothermal vent metagenome TaxID=652676 RepID=A0A3B1D8R0_9ZZZZ
MAKKILIVDDSPIIRLILSDLLKENGYEVVGEGCDGVEGVQKYKELKPDLVTMDITMPNKDGIDALRDILDINRNTKIIMITAIDQRDSLMTAIRAGAIDYIVKPFENDRVLSAIKKAIG